MQVAVGGKLVDFMVCSAGEKLQASAIIKGWSFNRH